MSAEAPNCTKERMTESHALAERKLQKHKELLFKALAYDGIMREAFFWFAVRRFSEL
jgi:hypothetical protein